MEQERLPFGKKVKCGNFLVLKRTKALGKGELKRMRNGIGIPLDVQKQLQRGGLPYIKVEALSGIWSVEYCCNTQMYMTIDLLLPKAIAAEEKGDDVKTTLVDFEHLFAMMMTDTMVLGDAEYQQDKAKAMKSLLERQKAPDGDDATILDEMRRDEEQKATIVDMVNELKKEDGDE